ncbi:GMP synthase [Rhodobacterales bacterium HKCCE4037]|nr:GMP synthase [Rhodobacterales bacterium HKCCE4037]
MNNYLLRTAVWNLAANDRFPGGAGDGIQPDDPQAARQALGLAHLDADLVTLVEVFPITHIERLRDLLAEKNLTYEITILPQPESHLHIGFLHKPWFTVENPRFIPGSEGTYAGGRQALAIDVTAGPRLTAVVIGVHLESGRDKPDQDRRDSQCRVIGDWIAALRQIPGYKRRPIILMGDFNMIPGQDVSNFHLLGADDEMNFVSSWDLQDRWSHILESGRANLLDGFAVSGPPSARYVQGSLRLFPMHWAMKMGRSKFRAEVSDHLPFTASFRVF